MEEKKQRNLLKNVFVNLSNFDYSGDSSYNNKVKSCIERTERTDLAVPEDVRFNNNAAS